MRRRPARSRAVTASLLLGLLAACGRPVPVAGAGSAASSAALIHDGRVVEVPLGSPLRQALHVVAASEVLLEQPISVPAAIEADPARLVKVAAPVGGRVVRLYKGLGDPVKAGEPLAQIDSADLAQATADASRAESALRLADRAYARQQELGNAEIAARKDIEQAESDRDQALIEARRARGRLAQLGVAAGRPTGNGRQYTLDSPISGSVIDMTGAQGGFWNDTNAPLLTVADLSKVWLTASVPESVLASIFVGQTVRITLNAYPGLSLSGQVAGIGQVLEADTRTVKARIVLDNAASRLRPGMFATATFKGPPHAAITLPAGALLQDGLSTRVWVERAPWRFEARSVQPGPQIGSEVEIASGLRAGERVVDKGAVLLND